MNLQSLKFHLRIVNNEGSCMTCRKTFLARFSSSKFELNKTFRDLYQIDDLYGNDFDDLVSRLFYVQAHEGSSWFLGLFSLFFSMSSCVPNVYAK